MPDGLNGKSFTSADPIQEQMRIIVRQPDQGAPMAHSGL